MERSGTERIPRVGGYVAWGVLFNFDSGILLFELPIRILFRIQLKNFYSYPNANEPIFLVSPVKTLIE